MDRFADILAARQADLAAAGAREEASRDEFLRRARRAFARFFGGAR
jgi:hypothetical protein